MKKRTAGKSVKVKNVTMDELARMMADEFSGVHGEMKTGFKEVHERIDELDERLSGQIRVLDQKITIVNTNVLALQFDYRKVVNRIENLELKTFGSIQE